MIHDPTADARWGVRQVKDGVPTGGGTVGWGWATREEAEEANPHRGGLELEAYDRFGGAR